MHGWSRREAWRRHLGRDIDLGAAASGVDALARHLKGQNLARWSSAFGT